MSEAASQRPPRRAWWEPARLSIPPWRVVVLVVGCAGVAMVALAAADLVRTGFTRPWITVAGLAATVLLSRVYIVVARRGEILEGIDIAEAPIVALALLLPPGQALLTFVIGSAIREVTLDRARVKKIFNVGVRALCAGLLLVPLIVVGRDSTPGWQQYVAVGIGAFVYTSVNALAVATIVALVQDSRVGAVLLDGIGTRALVWIVAVTLGMTSAYAALEAPGVLLGTLALLLVIALTTAFAQRADRESDRLRHVIDASNRIQAAGPQEAEEILLDLASELLLWKDVSVRDADPSIGEEGALLHTRDTGVRWLVATPRPDSDPWTDEDRRILQALALAASTAFERASLQAELSQQALLDPLTGAANRRHFDDIAAQASADEKGYGMVLCDLDGFKAINDRFGHDVGDELLKITSGRLRACVRASDVVARLGGDEFVVLVPGVGSALAMSLIASKIRARLDEPVQIGTIRLPGVRSSLGVATAPGDGASPREVLRAADRAMYQVKKGEIAPGATVAIPGVRLPADDASEPATRD